MRDEHVVKQAIDYSCGPACMATLMTWYLNHPVEEAEIIQFLVDNLTEEEWKRIEERQGFSLLDLKRFAKHHGYVVNGYRLDVEGLLSLRKPVIIPIRIRGYDHFVVFRGVGGNRVFLADPALGHQRMLVVQFKKMWKGGIGLVIQRPEDAADEGDQTNFLEVDEEEVVFPQDNLNAMLYQQSGAYATSPGEF